MGTGNEGQRLSAGKREADRRNRLLKIGGTYYEVSTSCGGSERLRDKMIRLIKSETVKPPNDKQG
ncbi:hypothetical protein [Schaedlerella arabinosiphila]|uniref:hypothetical protein n=1 Tax=Schaedlerella arabinosiphila TaxID=2044587 RepID=UPI0003A66134|nr:hypothetical protein [Schaedlerella arabinosiphila]